MGRRPRSPALTCALMAALAVAAGGCGGEPEEPIREGLGVDYEGLAYNVFITRQLYHRDVEDQAYYNGPEPPSGFTDYGVFLQVCNEEGGRHPATSHFKIVDTQGNEFEPLEVERDNLFAYRARPLARGECIPQEGSIASTSPTAGSLLLFRLPVATLENRPLELEVGEGPEHRKIELDI